MEQFHTVQSILCQSALTDVCRISSDRPGRLSLMLPPKKPVTVLHVKAGRAACMTGKQYQILSAGETVVLRQHEHIPFYTQTGAFQGIVICAKPEAVPPSLSEGRKELCRRFPDNADILGAFDAEISDKYAPDILRVLANALPDPESGAKICPRAQMHIACAAYAFASQHPEQHISIHALAEMLEVSPTHLKNGFRIVFGDSHYSYLRTQKMLAAAGELRRSSRTVLDIAGDYGYDNGSKFAKAFQDVTGISPREYRAASAPPECSIDGVFLHAALHEAELE